MVFKKTSSAHILFFTDCIEGRDKNFEDPMQFDQYIRKTIDGRRRFVRDHPLFILTICIYICVKYRIVIQLVLTDFDRKENKEK